MPCRSFYAFASNADPKAQEAQKTAGNPYAPTSSAGGTPTDNKADESERHCLICSHASCQCICHAHKSKAIVYVVMFVLPPAQVGVSQQQTTELMRVSATA